MVGVPFGLIARSNQVRILSTRRSATQLRLAQGEVTVPERACQAETVLLRIFRAAVALGVTARFSSSLVAVQRGHVAVGTLLCAPRLSSPRGVAIVLVRGDCPQAIPSRETAHVGRGRLCRVCPGRRGCIWCEFLAVRPLYSEHRAADSRPLRAEAAASTVTFELAQTGGISSCHTTTRIEQPGCIVIRQASFWLWGVSRGARPCATMRLTWAEGRALLRSNPSAVPGANTRMGRHDAALFHSGIGTKAPNLGSSPTALRPPQVLGTPRTSFVCSACAR
jgi:hypothetical protein